MARKERQKAGVRDFSGGIQEFTSLLLTSDNEALTAINVDVRVPGRLQKAKGYSQVGSTGSSGDVDGIGVFDQEDGTQTLLKWWNTNIYKLVGSTWTSIVASLTAPSQKVGIINTYTDDEERVYFASGLVEPLQHWDGTTADTVDNYYSKHIEWYQNRIYLGNVRVGDTAWLTATAYSEDDTVENDGDIYTCISAHTSGDTDDEPGTGATWATYWELTTTVYFPQRVLYSGLGVDTFDNDADFFDDIGDPITGLKAYAGYLYIFTANKLNKFDGYSLVPVPGDFGTVASQTIQVVEGRLVWYNRERVFIYGGSGVPTDIGRSIQGWLDLVSDPTACAGGIDSRGRYLLYIGDVTYKGTAYTDVVLRYDVLINAWDVLISRPFGVMTRLKSGGGYISYAGDVDNDKVWKIDDGTSLNSSAIASTYETKKFYGESVEDTKNFYKIYFTYEPTDNADYITVKFRLDGDSAWTQIKGTNNNIDLDGSQSFKNVFFDLPADTSGECIQLQFTHSSDSYDFSLLEYVIEYDSFGKQ